MNDLEKKSIECIKNMPIEETTYQVARNVVLDYITNLQEQLHQASLDIQELTERDIECPSWCDKLTNLQQENERVKKMNMHEHKYGSDMEEKYLIEKAKNDRAVEYIKFQWQEIIGNENYKNHLWTVDGLVIKKIIDILNGSDKEMKKKTISIGFPIEYEDDDQVCHYGLFLRENEVKAVDEKMQELQRKDNIINELKEWLNEPHITYNLDATEFGIEKIECVSVKDILDKIKEIESK